MADQLLIPLTFGEQGHGGIGERLDEQDWKPYQALGDIKLSHNPETPNERAGISPVTVRRIMADLEHNYYHARKTKSFDHLERHGLGMVKLGDLVGGAIPDIDINLSS